MDGGHTAPTHTLVPFALATGHTLDVNDHGLVTVDNHSAALPPRTPY